jgi:hypothetical protein
VSAVALARARQMLKLCLSLPIKLHTNSCDLAAAAAAACQDGLADGAYFLTMRIGDWGCGSVDQDPSEVVSSERASVCGDSTTLSQ